MTNGTYEAVVLRANADFRRETRPVTPPEADEAALRVRACGVCGSDVGRAMGGGAYHYPLVIGHEFAGEIEYDPTGVWTGKRVVVFPVLPCGKCGACRQELYAMCEHYDYYGSRRDGAFTERLNVRRANLLEIPAGVSFEAAAMCEPASVAHNAVCRAGEIAGRTVAVYGAGTIGLLVGQWARSFGAKVVFSEPDADKMAFAASLGFGALGADDRPDVYVDACGNPKALECILLAAKPRARVVLLGNPTGDVALSRAAYWRILRGELTLCGSWNSRFGTVDNDWRDTLAAAASGALQLEPLITHRYPLAEAGEALAMMASRRAFYVKVMLTVGAEA